MLNVIIILILAYLLGSLPAGKLVARIHELDITTVGSGNPGATNVWRMLGWKAALPVIIVDLGKGYAATVLVTQLQWGPLSVAMSSLQIMAGCCAIIGHMWSVFSNFSGGKGVLTALGMVVGLFPLAAGICVVLWIVIFSISRIVSLGSLIASLALPVVVGLQKYQFDMDVPTNFFVFSLCLCLAIW